MGLVLSVSLPSAACLTVVAASLGTLFPSYDKTVLSSAAGDIHVGVNIISIFYHQPICWVTTKIVVCNKLGVREVRWAFWLKRTSCRLIRMTHVASCV